MTKHYTHLTLEEGYQIGSDKKAGFSPTTIPRNLINCAQSCLICQSATLNRDKGFHSVEQVSLLTIYTFLLNK
ncbi:MAG: Unknown protein [uncultured Thiotrichaceae bacterium]|uniref:Uncharacterized protein n=1 Tax=uncultured Thiotrichaceae bacterium TaxID=298394 RepID=A0A6S6TSP3_9GAMM|nr:MAG: Unknown protein [uncultured Thiotrichaceae bacterium]